MEEKKETKEVKMKAAKNDGKYSYDELSGICAELSQENHQMKAYIQNLHKQIAQLESGLQYKRLDYLFKIMELSNAQNKWNFSHEFVLKCVMEIEEALTIPEEKEEQSKEN